MKGIKHNSFFLFEDYQNKRDYHLYIFSDCSCTKNTIQDKLFNVFDDVRKIVHRPERITVICLDISRLDIAKLDGRIINNKNINYINYQDISKDIFKKGISEIVKKNKVVQYAPTGTIFKKTSGKEESYFIKTSLALLEYSQTCFLALALYEQIKDELPQKIYIDVASISPLIQAAIHYHNLTLAESTYSPEIINFRSYDNIKSPPPFNIKGAYTVMSASTSGGLRKKLEIDESKCITIFYLNQKDKVTAEQCLFELKKETSTNHKHLKPIPLMSEDFSLEHAESREVTITKEKIRQLDKKLLIDKILSKEFLSVADFITDFHNSSKSEARKVTHALWQVLKGFIKASLRQSLTSEVDSYIIHDIDEQKLSQVIKKTKFKQTDKNNFLRSKDEYQKIGNKNIIVLLTESNNNELIHISQKLRKCPVNNIVYIIGVLLTDNIQHSKKLKNNICYNNSDYKYHFYCYLDLPLHSVNPYNEKLDSYPLTDGFVFSKDNSPSSQLVPKQVYFVICFILELLRDNNTLNDDISFHSVISPENFYRFNDSLLQLSILTAAKGRELNFHSNKELSQQMKSVVLDLKKEKDAVGDIFIHRLKHGGIKLTDSNKLEVQNQYPKLFKDEL